MDSGFKVGYIDNFHNTDGFKHKVINTQKDCTYLFVLTSAPVILLMLLNSLPITTARRHKV
jgi:hypothetical protein